MMEFNVRKTIINLNLVNDINLIKRLLTVGHIYDLNFYTHIYCKNAKDFLEKVSKPTTADSPFVFTKSLS